MGRREKHGCNLQVENLKTSFFTSNGEVQAVRGVSFSVNKGDILGIVGESGSGKKRYVHVYIKAVSRYRTGKGRNHPV